MSTTSADIIVMFSAFVMDECAWSLTTTRSGMSGSPASARRRRSVSRATTSADRFPADPPETKTPPAEAGIPAMSARVRSTWFSAMTAPAASNHEMPCSDAADTTMSNRSEAFVGADGMKVNIRGLSADSTVSARWLA